MPTFKITVAYDGTGFVGWQRQASGVSIQGLLEEALRALDQRDVAVAGAGRTDAGVHALGQVASLTVHRAIEAGALARAINGRLPAAVRVIAAEEVAETFHARFSATRKRYRYRISTADVLSPFERAYAWHVPGALDTGAMRAAAAAVEGRKDFAAFQAAGGFTRSSEREVFSSVVRTDDASLSGPGAPGHPAAVAGGLSVPASLGACAMVEYEIDGDGFLRHMVRNIVGSLVEIGRGRRPVEWMSAVLAGRDRTQAGPTAPAHGLVLVAVEYGRRHPA